MAVEIIHAAEGHADVSTDEIIARLTNSMYDVLGHSAWVWSRVAGQVTRIAPLDFANALLVDIAKHSEREHRYVRWAYEEVGDALEECLKRVPELAVRLLALWDDAPEFVEAQLGAVLFTSIDIRTLAEWASTERRQVALARMLPPSASPTTDRLIRSFGHDSFLAERMKYELRPRAWSGSLSSVLERRANDVRLWAKDQGFSAEFRAWAREAANWLMELAELRAKDED